MKTRLLPLVTAISFFTFATNLRAQGTAFTYQGQLLESGTPANGLYDLQFIIYNASVGGSQVGPILTNAATAVSNGLFTVTLDFGSGIFTGSNEWLDIAARTNGSGPFTPLSPRQELAPTPYAIFANTSSNLSGTLSTAQLSGTVDDAQLTHSAITLNPGPGLSGGGRVALGNATTLTNTGVLAVTGNADITAATVAGAVTLGDTATSADTPGAIVKRDGSGDFSAASITLDGNLNLPATTATAGVIYSGAETVVQAFGTRNFFAGQGAGNLTLGGSGNTGVGYQALVSDTIGSENTANGAYALHANTNGSQNTATGNGALYSNTSGSQNTANGFAAMDANTIGSENTAVGFAALNNNTNGSLNTASGFQALMVNTSGSYNTATGGEALESNTNGDENTATGYLALYFNTSGSQNTATGVDALLANTSGYGNTANGYAALYANTTGAYNTANGYQALESNTNGSENTAIGDEVLVNNTSGDFNTAAGDSALYSNTRGTDNTAFGAFTLFSSTTASNNTAMGTFAMEGFSSGTDNTADGFGALSIIVGGGNTAVGSEAFEGLQASGHALNNNTAIGAKTLANLETGNNNTALGWESFYNLTNGGHNIAVGYQAGLNVMDGSYNIEIGNAGTATDTDTIRIGIEGTQSDAFIAGIWGNTLGGASPMNVYVDNTGHLGTFTSSRRFKQDIHSMAEASQALYALRPVTFKYRSGIDPTGTPQFGLVAEEVNQVDPDLVVRDDKKQIYSVRYEAVNAMLLNEFLKEHRKVEAQDAEIGQQHTELQELNQKVEAQNSENAELKRRLQALERIVLGQQSKHAPTQ